ncbi:MAG: hypothetical protein Kow00128_07900 [Deltaproteobacteria bacterium]
MTRRVAVLPMVVILAALLGAPAVAGADMPGADPAPGALPGVAEAPPEGGAAEGLVHTVVPGDTLWDLSARYLGSPWRWPELWERNRYLTNPHYIYPGIRVVIFPPPPREYGMEVFPPEPAAEEAPKPEEPAAETAPKAPEEAPARTERFVDVPETEVVRAGVFLPERPEGIGHIREGVDARVAFAERDKVFLSLTREIPAGQMLGVYRVRGPVGPPGGGSVSGYVRYLVGVLQVTEPEGGKVTAVVRKSFEDLSRADQIDEEIPGFSPIAPKPGGDGLESVVLTGRGENTEFAAGHVVYLDKGSEAGVEVGNLFRILDGGDEANWDLPRSDEPSGPVEVAKVVVVRTLPGSSSAYVLSGTQSFPAGVIARR